MKTCSACQLCYDDAYTVCEQDNHDLINARSGSREIIANFRLDLLLCRDPLSETYQASHALSNKIVVIKFISPKFADDAPTLRERFLSESQAAAGISHPNIARIYQSGVLDGDEFYTVSEAVNGQALREYEDEKGAISEIEAVSIARQIADALNSAHKAGVVHRLLNPANVVLIFDKEKHAAVKLQHFDFGGVAQQSLTSNLAQFNFDEEWLVEKIKYLSPEQCARQTVDEHTDIYSLGVVFFELLNGKPPFEAQTFETLVDKQINQEPPPLETQRLDIKALLNHTVMQSLKKIPSMRLQKAQQFVSQLRHIEQLGAYSHSNLESYLQIAPVKQKEPEVLAVQPINETPAPSAVSNLLIIDESVENEFLDDFANGFSAPVTPPIVQQSYLSERIAEPINTEKVEFLSDEDDFLLNPDFTVKPRPRTKADSVTQSIPQTENKIFAELKTNAVEIEAEEDYQLLESEPPVSSSHAASRMPFVNNRPNSILGAYAAQKARRHLSLPRLTLPRISLPPLPYARIGAAAAAIIVFVLLGALFSVWQSQSPTPETARLTTSIAAKSKKSAPAVEPQVEAAIESGDAYTDDSPPQSIRETKETNALEPNEKNPQNREISTDKQPAENSSEKEPIIKSPQTQGTTEISPPEIKSEENPTVNFEANADVQTARKRGKKGENESISTSENHNQEIAEAEQKHFSRQRIVPLRSGNGFNFDGAMASTKKNGSGDWQCTMQVNRHQFSVLRNGGAALLEVIFENPSDAEKLRVTTDNPVHLSIALKPDPNRDNSRRLYQITSISEFTKIIKVFLKSPCGKEEVKVKVT